MFGVIVASASNSFVYIYILHRCWWVVIVSEVIDVAGCYVPHINFPNLFVCLLFNVPNSQLDAIAQILNSTYDGSGKSLDSRWRTFRVFSWRHRTMEHWRAWTDYVTQMQFSIWCWWLEKIFVFPFRVFFHSIQNGRKYTKGHRRK